MVFLVLRILDLPLTTISLIFTFLPLVMLKIKLSEFAVVVSLMVK